MTDLRLVGVHEDGEHLLLSGTGGEIFLLPIDEALRMATTRSPRRSFQAGSSSTRLSPREIQAQIRGGATAADVAEHSGLSLEQVRRYEGPVLAEREYVAQQARKVEVCAPSPGNDGYRSAFGDNPATLNDMLMHRLAAFGIDPRTVRWDAWRIHDGSWTVTADFEPGTEWAASSIGEPAPARWTFHTGRKSLLNANRWAQQLSEMEPLEGPVPERRLSAVADRPFDFESDTAEPDGLAGEHAAEAPTGTAEEPVDGSYPGNGLLDMLRSRRGQRLGLDEDGDDELAAMLGTHVPAAHPRDGHELTDEPAQVADEPSDAAAPATAPSTGSKHLRAIPFLSLAPSLQPSEHDEPSPVGIGEISMQTREITLSGAPSLRQSAANNGVDLTPTQAPAPPAPAQEPGPTDSEVAARLERKASGKPKRSSVPSWDEIVFGTKGD
ncbi:septation protein SepH [Arthrobacter sp. AQ5-05]|uniref:septation protein SepH n=1 Tax=Arthrobacter sp. AQ5-05 TaxID=2184581 RepID=UPI0012B5619B|nr:septation protein SepH [Arthrobacter sp. AQ5-05]